STKIRTSQDPKYRLRVGRSTGPLDSHIVFAVAVVIARSDQIGGQTPMNGNVSLIGTSKDEPDQPSVDPAYNSEVRLTIAVIISCDRFIVGHPPMHNVVGVIGAV